MIASTATTSALMTFHTASLDTFSDAIIQQLQGLGQFMYSMSRRDYVGKWQGCRVWLYRRKGSDEPGSVAIFCSASGSENQFFGILSAKDAFPYTKDTFYGSLDTEPVSWFWFADLHFVYRCIPCLRESESFMHRPNFNPLFS